MASSSDNCRLISLPKIENPRGNLTFIEGNRHIPFEIKRVYYLYDIPHGSDRGGHAHKSLQQMLIAVSGSFEVKVSDGRITRSFPVNRADTGLYIPKMHWRELFNFTAGAVCLVLASAPYEELDYLRDYNRFLEAVGQI